MTHQNGEQGAISRQSVVRIFGLEAICHEVAE
jgi:hypothetical protein